MSADLFTGEDEQEIKRILQRYPKERAASAVMPLLTLAQKRCGGFLTVAAMDEVARRLAMAPVRVYEVAHFYSMYHHEFCGARQIHICTSISCWLRGGAQLLKLCRAQRTADDDFTVHEAQCLGACVDAPVAMMDGRYHERLDEERLQSLMKGKKNAS